jgi:hypothetical protein
VAIRAALTARKKSGDGDSEDEEAAAKLPALDDDPELALLKDAPRAATVRCQTPVDVIIFNRKDFLTLVDSYSLFRHHMDAEATAVAEFQKNHMATIHAGVETGTPRAGER